jgi:type VI protein secretion system component Hcp
MAVDAFIYFTVPQGSPMPQPVGESQDAFFSAKSAFEIKEFSFDVENAHTVGSATKGAGSGKVKFNEFTIKKPTDTASAIFFQNCVTGAHYDKVVISIRKSGSSNTAAGGPYLEYCFSVVFTTKIEWSGPGDEGPEESITFAYGQLGIRYSQQDKTGAQKPGKIQGWDQMINKAWTPPDGSFSSQGGIK